MKPKIRRVIMPPISPFNAQGQIDPAAFKRLVDFLIERGIHGLFPGGTTGEGPLLSITELAKWLKPL
jgi:dihydrodipicolinate synthase/N-acetylneuraminate lyase